MMTRELEQDVERLVAAVQILAADVRQAAELSETSDTQFARRAYVRAAFALIEGNLNLMADVVLHAAEREEVHLQPGELEILRQERHASDKEGIAVVTVKFVPIRGRIVPIFELFARLYGQSFRLDKGGIGWAHFTRAIELRNRITHPKDATSFMISDEELDGVEKARQWFADGVEKLLNTCG